MPNEKPMAPWELEDDFSKDDWGHYAEKLAKALAQQDAEKKKSPVTQVAPKP